jgi:DNA-binding XRE family transcriptional regulator
MSSKKVKQIEEGIIDSLSKKRKELGYSYEKLSELTGLHRTSISLIERKKTHPTLLVCLKLP